MNIFLTGATGYIGQRLAIRLATEGQQVVALVRDPVKAAKLLNHSNIHCVQGDLSDPTRLKELLSGCSAVYHLAALASVWDQNPAAFDQINVNGVKYLLDACIENKIVDFVFTSSAGVVGHSTNGKPVQEYTNSHPMLETEYERTKVEAEELIQSYCSKGIRGIIVNPSRVYGPGRLTESNGITRLVKMYISGKWHIIPGNGSSIGNYVYIDDVINGHILAMEYAKPGERYLLGGENINFDNFFELVAELSGKNYRLFHFPLSVMLALSKVFLFVAETTGKKPLITPPFVRKYNKNWILSSAKAEIELGYRITPLRTGLQQTLQWLNSGNG
jgi:nucleoside-diphosphate-sugar epimerase